MVDRINMLLKQLVNGVFGPTWCEQCGNRLTEQAIGFREQGSRYSCVNPRCATFGSPTLVLGP